MCEPADKLDVVKVAELLIKMLSDFHSQAIITPAGVVPCPLKLILVPFGAGLGLIKSMYATGWDILKKSPSGKVSWLPPLPEIW